MRFVTFQRQNFPEPGIIEGDEIISLYRAGFPDLISLISHGADALTSLQSWTGNPPWGETIKLADAQLMAPIPRPPKVICVGLNYRDHAEESKMEIPSVPTIFCKFPTSVIGPGQRVILPKRSTKPDYEAELGIVIGRRGRYITAENWRDYVFGYTCVNDVSARDFQMATTQWIMGKTFDTFCPIGPWIVTADEIPDPHVLDICMSINGEQRQCSNTKNLIFNIPTILEHLSSVFTLEPGDIIATGTPAGVGYGFNPPRWLKPGDECVVSISGIGELRSPCIAEE